MKSLKERFGILLKDLRTKKGYTQSALAIDCELDRTYISLLERGKRQPSLTTLFSIARVLGITPSSIVKELERT